MSVLGPWRSASAGRRGTLVALALYCAVSFLYFGLRLVLEPGSRYVGSYDRDPQTLIWGFAWYPHAILSGENPLAPRSGRPPGST